MTDDEDEDEYIRSITGTREYTCMYIIYTVETISNHHEKFLLKSDKCSASVLDKLHSFSFQ